MTRRTAMSALALAVVLGTSACSGSSSVTPSAAASTSAGEKFPDVTKATVSGTRERLSFAVTVTSPYDTAERYADSIRVRSVDGKVFGERMLDHDHASEQPFTRSIDGVTIPEGVTEVVVEGHDQVSGWGGATVTVTLP